MAIWDKGLIEMLKWNREQKTIEDEEVEKGMCPDDAWPLKENEKGKKVCLFCGRLFN